MTIKTITSASIILLLLLPSLMRGAGEATILLKDTSSLEAVGDMRDVVYLKNGSIIRGKVVEMIPDSTIRIQTADGSVFVYPMKEVEKMTKEEVATVFQDTLPAKTQTGRHARTQIAPLIGYGTKDWFSLGFGLRVGATFETGTYFGGIFVYHVGKSQDLSYNFGYGVSYSFSVKYNTLYLGPEIGYDARASEDFTVRPYCSFGYLSLMASVEGSGSSASDSKGYFFVSPGIMLNVIVSERATIGLDGRYIIITGENNSDGNSPGIYLSLGITP